MKNSIEVNIGKINVPSTESEVQKESPKKVDINLEVKKNVLDKNQTVFEESILRNQDGPKKNEMRDKPLVISNTKKSMESIECPNVIVNKSLLGKGITKNLQIILRNEEGLKIGHDNDEQCRYLEKPSPSSDRRLQFIFNYVGKLEETLKQPLHKKSQNQIVPSRRGRKRKLEENVDLKNNNSSYEQTTGIKKRKRCIAPNPNLAIAKATKEKLCNNTDISPNGSFSLPLSPAESDKSVDKKEEELPKLTKQKKNVIMRIEQLNF
ncbi:hypothetical protein NQ318_001625 [Aromia moschata]|uniref:Uncharacterized protein n=1 Tax=Aromia moschata TaxID=1265417 RepID=A0AAV8Y2G3_9CUCU|nr:hypothetical protein NQ318_001625 [Aromia moschata]